MNETTNEWPGIPKSENPEFIIVFLLHGAGQHLNMMIEILQALHQYIVYFLTNF